MHVVSFENDLDPLKLAFLHNREFTYLRHAGVGGILDSGRWQSSEHAGLCWTLVLGDFPEKIPAAPDAPDLIFFDMFSSKTDAELWTLGAFQKIFAACGEHAVELFTYTCSTPVRASLLAAGFHVARGRSTVDKSDTTIALTPAALSGPQRHELLATTGSDAGRAPRQNSPQTFPRKNTPHLTRDPLASAVRGRLILLITLRGKVKCDRAARRHRAFSPVEQFSKTSPRHLRVERSIPLQRKKLVRSFASPKLRSFHRAWTRGTNPERRVQTGDRGAGGRPNGRR